jgi:hypothetical protein
VYVSKSISIASPNAVNVISLLSFKIIFLLIKVSKLAFNFTLFSSIEKIFDLLVRTKMLDDKFII